MNVCWSVSLKTIFSAVPVRQFGRFKDRRFSSGRHWPATTGGLVAFENRIGVGPNPVG
jgi:hypothetical protein